MMHELDITKKLVKLVKEKCGEEKIIPKKVCLEIGELTTYKKEPIKYYFEKISGLDCELEINMIKPKVKCNNCGNDSVIDPLVIICGECGSSDVKIFEGKDIVLRRIAG